MTDQQINFTNIVNVKVKYIRPTYKNLRDWQEDSNNEYIGRKGVVFIDGARWPPQSSPFANPFRIDKNNTRDDVIDKYKTYMQERLANEPELVEQLNELREKNLGCWCYPEKCHGDVLVELIDQLNS